MAGNDRTYRKALDEAQPRIEALRMQWTSVLDQVLAFWRDVEPAVRAFVAECDELTEQDWMDMPESTRNLYVDLKRILSQGE